MEPEALARPEVAAELGLSDEQKEQIHDLAVGALGGWNRGAGGRRPDAHPAGLHAVSSPGRAERMKERVREVLSDSQKAKLAELLGQALRANGRRSAARTWTSWSGGPGGLERAWRVTTTTEALKSRILRARAGG